MPSADALLKNKDRFKNIKPIEFNTKKSQDTAIKKYAEESRQADKKNNPQKTISSKKDQLDSKQTANRQQKTVYIDSN